MKVELARAQNMMNQLADRKRSEREFSVGEDVYMKLGQQHLKALTPQPISKLSPKYYGPFTIVEKIGTIAYRLQLPEETQMHLVFHISLLKKTIRTQRSNASLPPIVKKDREEAIPTVILD